MILFIITIISVLMCSACGGEQEEVLAPGRYTFYNEAAGGYLAYQGNALTLSSTPVEWVLKAESEKGVHVYAGDTELMLDIDNAYIREGTAIKIWSYTGYDAQIWNVTGNTAFSFLYSGDHRYCLGFEKGQAVLQLRNTRNGAQEWKAVKTGELAKEYCSVFGSRGIIELRLPLDISTVISAARLQQWANDLETAYDSYYELTGFKPYQTILVEAYKPCEYIGYVMDGSNIIHIDRDFIYEDLRKMASRRNDWNFCALHEMGHMFDFGRPWTFEAEMMTDLKLAYVLEQNGAGAAPSEFPASDCFYGKDIIRAYEILGGDFSKTYNIFGCARRFLQIKEEIGWEPFRQTFHWMQENANAYSATKEGKLHNFVSVLSGYSGKDIKSYFSAGEWASMIEKTR
ncbi:MAG: hypothetical protein IJ043_01605 [Clostridia bacterium]|nr:hypothetical protein [Clostridia bacterium]